MLMFGPVAQGKRAVYKVPMVTNQHRSIGIDRNQLIFFLVQSHVFDTRDIIDLKFTCCAID